MKTRIIAAVALLPLLLIVVIVLPAIYTAILMAALCAIGAYELLYNTGYVKHPRLLAYTMLFAALVSFDRVQLVKLYPEQEPAVRFAGVRPGDRILVYCNRHGLFAEKAARRSETD